MILMYHKVHLESPGIWWVTADDFYRQMCELSGYKVVYLDDYDPADPKQVVITFDGIYRNVLQSAAPILHKFGYPFELFLSSDFIGGDNSFDKGEPLAEFATSDELKRLCELGGRLQWHTRSHPKLTTLTDSAQLESELTVPDAVAALDPQGFGWFAYPYGEFNQAVVDQCRKRFRGAVSCIQGNDSDRFILNRVTVTNESSFKRETIGVIIPSYNYGHFLVEAVESVLRQTRLPDEILIADDCSSDNTVEIANRFRDRYPDLIRVQRNPENLGIVANFNRAALAAKSDYLCFLGADNRFRSDYLERTAAVLDAHEDCGIAYTDYALFGPRAQLEYSAAYEPWRGPVKQGEYYVIQFPDFTAETRELLQTRNFIHGSSLFRKRAFLDVNGYCEESNRPEDHALFRRIVNHGWQAQRVPQPLLEYRQHSFGQANSRYVSYRELQFYRQEFTTLSSRLTSVQSEREAIRSQLQEVKRACEDTQQALHAYKETQSALRHELHESQRSVVELRPLAERAAIAEQQLRSIQAANSARLAALEEQLHNAVGATLERRAVGAQGAGANIVRASGALCIEHVNPALNLPALKQTLRARARRVKRKLNLLKQQLLPSSSDRHFLPYYVISAQGASLLRTECSWRNTEGRAAQLPMSATLLAARPLYFGFNCPVDGLREVGFMFGTNARTNHCNIRLEVQDWSAHTSIKVLRRCSVNASVLQDNAFYTFCFEPIAQSKGMLLRIAINSSDCAAGNQVALWGSNLSGLSSNKSPFILDRQGRCIATGYLQQEQQALRVGDLLGESKDFFMPTLLCRYPQPSLQVFTHGWQRPELPMHWYPLPPNYSIRLSFRAAYDYLEGISLIFGTFGRENEGSVFLELYEATSSEASIVRRASLSARSLRDNEFAEFTFSPISNAKGKTYTLVLSCPDCSADRHLALWGNVLPIEQLPIAPVARPEALTLHSEGMQFELRTRELGTSKAAELDSTHAFIPVYRAQGVEGALQSEEFGWNGPSFEREPFRILPTSPVSFSFSAPLEVLSELRLLVATYARSNDCTLVMELLRRAEDGTLCSLSKREYCAKDFVDNQYHRFTFAPIHGAQHALFVVRISSPDATPSDSVALWGTRVELGSSIHRKMLRPEHAQASWVDFQESRIDSQRFLESTAPRLWLSSSPLRGHALQRMIILVPLSAEWPAEKYRSLLTQLSAQGLSVEIYLEDALDSVYRSLLEVQLVLLVDLAYSDALAQLVRVSRRAGRLLGFYWSASSGPRQSPAMLSSAERNVWARCAELRSQHLRLMRESDFILLPAPEPEAAPLLATPNEFAADAARGEVSSAALESCTLQALAQIAARCEQQRLPHFTIISVLYGKQREVPLFLQALRRQSYQGEYDLLFVNDCSPDQSVKVAQEYWQQWQREAAASGEYVPAFRIIENDKNIGNCGSRNRAILEATGDALLIVDADCLLSRDLLQAHADMYARADCDVAIGYMNLETASLEVGGEQPLRALEHYENNWPQVEAHSQLQDPINHDSFLNCITRNFSIRRSFLERQQLQNLFDPLFSYSRDPASGFGWEDVEMGYRVFKAGARIKFAESCFSIHVSHPPAVPDASKPPRSLLNFRRLIDKHPAIVGEARRWVLDTYQKICAWGDSHGASLAGNREHLEHVLQRFPRSALLRRAAKPLRILSYRWHCGHQYELYKSGHQFTLLRFPMESFTNHWSYEQRPFARNASFKPVEAIDFRDYDAAILHFDENVLAPENSNGVLGSDWGHNFKWFMANVPLPKVAICHGTPQFYGQYDGSYKKDNLLQTIEPERARMVDFLGDTLVIVNSYQAQREWDFKKSRVIWHGFDPSEYAASTYSKGILRLGGALESRPHYRGLALYQKVIERLPDDCKPTPLHVDEPGVDYVWGNNTYALQKFRNYIDSIRQFSVYFNPTLRSPMPRSRAEAMLCGLVSVSANNHDVEHFIKNGVNGFYSNDPAELADYLIFLLKNPMELHAMGVRSHQLAADIFNHDRYLSAWSEVLAEVVR